MELDVARVLAKLHRGGVVELDKLLEVDGGLCLKKK